MKIDFSDNVDDEPVLLEKSLTFVIIEAKVGSLNLSKNYVFFAFSKEKTPPPIDGERVGINNVMGKPGWVKNIIAA